MMEDPVCWLTVLVSLSEKRKKKSVDAPYGRCSLLSLVQRDCKSLLRFLVPSGKAKCLIIIGYGYSSIATTRYVCGVDYFHLD